MSATRPELHLPLAPIDLAEPLAGLDGMEEWDPPRREKREQVVRIAEYSHYPRRSSSQRREIGYTRDESRSGLCIATSDREEVGTLLRVALRHVDGSSALEALARVVWCEARADGRYWVGVAFLMEKHKRRMRTVRRDRCEREAS